MPDPGLAILLWLLASALIAIGFAGLVLPDVPGIPLIYAGVVLLARAEDFAYVGWLTHTFPGQAGVGAVLGLLFGALVKIALAFIMLGVFMLDRLI